MEDIEIIRKLEKMGKVKDIREAFIEFPLEEEWHKGDEKIMRKYLKSIEKLN